MEDTKKPQTFYNIISFIAIVLLIIGIYFSVKTIVNFIAFDKYPVNISFLSMMSISPYGSEEDCSSSVFISPAVYTDSGETREPTAEEKKQQEEEKQNCLKSVEKNRKQTKVNDILTSFLFLFLGVGILATRRYMVK